MESLVREHKIPIERSTTLGGHGEEELRNQIKKTGLYKMATGQQLAEGKIPKFHTGGVVPNFNREH